MTKNASHIRRLNGSQQALTEAVNLYSKVIAEGVKVETEKDLFEAVQVRHLSLASVAFIKAIVELISQGSGSRGSHMVISDESLEIHSDTVDTDGSPPKFKPQNTQPVPTQS